MKYIIGIDEVGRGPLAGPVTIGVVVCEENLYKRLRKDKNLPKAGKDSKKLSPELRQKYSRYLKTLSTRWNLVQNGSLEYTTIYISNKVIDKIGISNAIKKAIERSFKNLNLESYLKIKNCKLKILLDGGLKAPKEFKRQKMIIKGDEKEKIIAWASILAKVSRDALMCRLAKKYPKYGFEIHKGYGTRKHLQAIKKYGMSPIHRKSFCKNYL